MSDLKACPFCGRIPDIEDCGEHRWFIRCKCGIAQDKLFFQKCDAVRAWNKRKELRVKDTNVPITDTISRQAAIDAADSTDYTGLAIEDVKKVTDEVIKALKRLPSAQTEEDTIEMHEADIDETMKRLRDARVTIPLSVQPEIVYCRDCKHWLHEHLCIELSKYGTIETLPNEFCSRAERKNDGSD